MTLEDFQNRAEIRGEELPELIGLVLRQHLDYEKKEKLERFRRLNRYVRPGQIVFAGSSLMEQFPIHELMLDRELMYTIYNRGIGGYTTPELMKTLNECIYDLKPSYVFLNIGTNDLNEPDYDRDVMLGNYEQILRGIMEHLPEAEVYTLAYYPVNPVVAKQQPHTAEMLKYRTNRRIQDASRGVRELSERLGMHFLDLNEGLGDEQGNLREEYTLEGVHMYADGYRVILDNLLPVLEQIAGKEHAPLQTHSI